MYKQFSDSYEIITKNLVDSESFATDEAIPNVALEAAEWMREAMETIAKLEQAITTMGDDYTSQTRRMIATLDHINAAKKILANRVI